MKNTKECSRLKYSKIKKLSINVKTLLPNKKIPYLNMINRFKFKFFILKNKCI